MILVPRDTPGVAVLRGMEVFGYDDHDHGGHAEIVFSDVRVPAANLIGAEGDGFAIAQARLGPGRIHHCMRSIGVAERAIELMCARADERVAFGKPLAEQGVIRDWIAESRVRVEQLRLLVLKAAWLMDTVGNKAAHTEIQAIKIATPSTVEWILDKAIQVHGAGGLSQDFPLAALVRGHPHAAFRRRPGRGAQERAGPRRAQAAASQARLRRRRRLGWRGRRVADTAQLTGKAKNLCPARRAGSRVSSFTAIMYELTSALVVATRSSRGSAAASHSSIAALVSSPRR